MEWLRACVRVRVRVRVRVLALVLVRVLVLVDVVRPPIPGLAWPSPNSWQPRGCGSVAFAAAVALLSLALRSMNDTPMHLHAPCEHT